MILDRHSRIAELKLEWDRAQPLSAENEQRLWRKLRLEWNYNSNHIEGNTLTYGETELLIIQGKTTGQHELREYEEMKAHDVAIQYIREMAQEERPITEGDIRGLNQIILKEPFWKEAITADGQPSRKQIIPGAYKTTPNNVKTATGEMFMFKSPEETPLAMAELTGWFREKLEDQSLDLPLFLATFHHRFSVIHPFDDGNGRTMRLLVNYALLKKGYLPIIIKSESKKEYLGVLGAADAGDVQPFAHLIQNRMIEVLEMGVKASRGESIEEPEDWQKEMSLFVQDHSVEGPPAPKKSPELLVRLLQGSWSNIINDIIQKASPLRKLFASCDVSILYCQANNIVARSTPDRANEYNSDWSAWSYIDNLYVMVEFKGFSSPGVMPFDQQVSLAINLGNYRYDISSKVPLMSFEWLRYDRDIDSAIINQISSELIKTVFDKTRQKVGGA